jgi:hypothetical protein
MAWKLIAGVAMCATFSGVAPGLVRGRATPPSPTRFFNLRVCTDNAFSKAQNECTTDQRGRKLVSSKFICSVRFLPLRQETLRARIIYAGTVVTSYTARITDKRLQIFSIADDLGTTALPNGAWRCEFSFGSEETGATFLSGGPTGPIVGAAVCGGSDVIRRIGVATCRSDESASQFRAPKEIACSGVFVRAVGKEAEIHLRSGGHDLNRSYALRIRQSIAVASVRFRPEHGAQRFAPGQYACRFSLKGAAVIQKPFKVTA